MRPRSCFVQVWISNDKGEKACYSLRPLPAEELGQSAAGFFLTKLADSSPVYAVRVEVNGVVSCNCPQYNMTWACKHSDALVASGVLPCNLLSLLRLRTKLVDKIEADAKKQAATVANLSETVERLTARADCLQQMVDEAQDEIVRLDKPKARRRVAQAKAA
jgi:hypothetical protein